MKKTLIGATALTALATAWAVPAVAQDQDDTARLGTVTVTAQRVQEDLQDTPVAVTALDTALLEDRQVADVIDLNFNVPNLTLSTGTGTANSARIFLRGVGEDESRGAVDPAIGIYVDGVYLGRQVGSLFDVVDLEAIEVLRGPQGTLYGRSTNGGAIKLTSVKPEDETKASAGLSIGTEGLAEISGMGNLAISEQTAIRISGMYRQRDGFFEVEPNGSRTGESTNVGEIDTFGIRAQLSHDFGNGWDVLVAADNTEDQSDPLPGSYPSNADGDGDLFTIDPFPGTDCDASPNATGCFTGYSNDLTARGASLTINGELDNFNLTSITAYREMNDELDTLVGESRYMQETDQDQISQEITLSSDFEGPFNFVSGLYYFSEDVLLETVFVFPFTVDTQTESFALFGQGTYDVTDRLTLTGGLRYTEETKDFDGAREVSFIPGDARVDDQDFDFLSYTAIADYQITDSVMGYVSYKTGFKSGGWSPDCFSATACFLPVEEEEVGTFELGVRSDLLEDRLRLNATYFHNSYDNLQLAGTVTGLGFTRFNVAEAETSGFELEAQFQATPELQFFGSLGLLDTEYKSVTEAQANAITINGTSVSCDPGQDVVDCALGLDMKNAPEVKGQIGATYTTSFAGGELSLTGDVGYEDEYYILLANSPEDALTDATTVLNLRATYQPDDANWSVSVWGKNVTDEEYYRAGSSANGSVTAYGADPAVFGIDFDVEF
ncbi:MAG: TonB-dependent receptor [Henriciella sp.]|nr:TonB-dependent receptor [Henriciella sp.]